MKLLTATAIVVVTLMLAAPAWAHDEISPATVPIGKPVFLTLTSANERSAELTSVTLTAPDGVPLGAATRQPPGWTAQRSDTAITWTGGAVAPGAFEQWGFEIESVGQPGLLTWSVATGYANGASDTHQVEVVAVASGTEPTVPATPATVPSTTVTAGATTVPVTATAASGSDDRATAALVVGIVAVVLAAVALVMSIRARRRPSEAPGSSPADEGQDW